MPPSSRQVQDRTWGKLDDSACGAESAVPPPTSVSGHKYGVPNPNGLRFVRLDAPTPSAEKLYYDDVEVVAVPRHAGSGRMEEPGARGTECRVPKILAQDAKSYPGCIEVTLKSIEHVPRIQFFSDPVTTLPIHGYRVKYMAGLGDRGPNGLGELFGEADYST